MTSLTPLRKNLTEGVVYLHLTHPNRYHVKYASMVDCPQDYEPSIRIVILEAHVFFNQSFLCYIQICGWFVCRFLGSCAFVSTNSSRRLALPYLARCTSLLNIRKD